MKRRGFMAATAGALMWPLCSPAQTARVHRIGGLILANPEPYWTHLRDGLRDLGYVDGKNVQLDFRSADGKPDVLAANIAELVRSKIDLIIAIQTPVVKGAMAATKQIPILLIAGNPVETGIVPNLNRPGGNVTGVTMSSLELAAKTLEIMREVLPSLRRVSVLINANDLGFGKPMLEQIQAAGRSLSIEVQPMIARPPEELEAAFQSIVKNRAQAAVAQPSLPRERIAELGLKHRVPVICPNPAWAAAGAFMSYAPDLRDACRKVAGYADRILKGANPGELPIQQPTQFELVINQKTARAIGLAVPQSVLLRADRVIE